MWRICTLVVSIVLCVAGHLRAQRPPDIALTPEMNREAVTGVLRAVERYYVSADGAKVVNEAIGARLERGEYDKVTSAFDLVDLLDAHLQEASGDAHLKMSYSPTGSPVVEGEEHRLDTPEELEEDRQAAREMNFGIERAARLPGNVGILDVRAFVRPEFAGETVGAAMTLVADTEALIVDLRSSRGGSPDMVLFLASYFFPGEEPFHLGDFRTRYNDETQQLWTYCYVPGRRYPTRDVYVLVSRNTFSAPEGLASFLQHHKRAIVVGERTRGGTHPGKMIKVSRHFGAFVPTDKPVYPVGTPKLVLGRPYYEKWESDDRGRGIKPDIEVPAKRAVNVAHAEALKRVLARSPDRRDELQPIIDGLEREGG